MNVPINYDDDTERQKTHPLLLSLDERPLCPNKIPIAKDPNHSFQECVGD
jgi:hypothetical protein